MQEKDLVVWMLGFRTVQLVEAHGHKVELEMVSQHPELVHGRKWVVLMVKQAMDLGLGTVALLVVKVETEVVAHLGPMEEMVPEERKYNWQVHGTLAVPQVPLREEQDLGHKVEVDMVMVGLGALVAQDHGQEQEMEQEIVADIRALVDQGPGQVQVMVEAAVRGLRMQADQALGLVSEVEQETVQDLRAMEDLDPGQVQETVQEQEASVEQGHGQVSEMAVVPNSAHNKHHGTKEDMVGTEKQVDQNLGLE